MDVYKERLVPLVVAGTITLAACAGPDGGNALSGGGTSEPAPGYSEGGDNRGAAEPIFLDQGFTGDDRQAFYYLSQGSQLIPYHWFLALEQAHSQILFRDDAHVRELGYITQPPDHAKNPDGLPIGFTRDDNSDTVDSYLLKKQFLGPDYRRENYPTTNAWMGLTCAACHTTQMDYKGHSIRIDGGPALAGRCIRPDRRNEGREG